ncbi:hypothetical protein ABZP36_017401 [Zizania latifolia]
MTSPAPSCTSSAHGPGDCEGVGCASSHDVWPLHLIRLDGRFHRLCSSCFLLSHRGAFCSVCLLFVFPDPAFQEGYYDPIVACSRCAAVAHLSCTPDPSYFVCSTCAAAAEGRAFSYAPTGGAPRALDDRTARVIFVAAQLAHESVNRDAVAAREEADRLVREAAVARKRARDMLDVASRALEAEARDAKKQALSAAIAVVPTAPTPATLPAPAAPDQPKKKTPKSNVANRDSDKFLKIKPTQQPALVFAAAAASSLPLSTPSSGEEKKPMKQGRGSANRVAKDDRRTLFGAFQS